MLNITVNVWFDHAWVEITRYQGETPRVGDEIGLMKFNPARCVRVHRVRRGVASIGMESTAETWCLPIDMDGERIETEDLLNRWETTKDELERFS